jgi:ribose/xylose/arabinose/galactoside ABC-type transport system permease subunit
LQFLNDAGVNTISHGLFVAMYVLLNWTRMGRYFYAVGGHIKASRLSGINTRFYLFMAIEHMFYAACWPRSRALC